MSGMEAYMKGMMQNAQMQVQQSQAARVQGKITPERMEAIDATAEDFEAVFVSQMLAPMFEGVGENDPYFGGQAERIWRGQLVQQYGREIAEQGGVGVAEHVKATLLQLQEIQ